MEDNPEIRLGDAAAIVAQESPDAATFLVNLMERNHIENENNAMRLYEWEREKNEQLRNRIRDLENQLDLIHHRHDFMLGLVHTPFPVQVL